jgi:hypothetical protein
VGFPYEVFGDVVSRWVAAETAGDAEALELLLDEEFRGDDPFGFVLSKQAWISRHRDGELVIASFAWRSTDVSMRDGTAVTSGIQTQKAFYRGVDCSGRYRVTVLARRSGGTWRIVNLQLIRIDEATEMEASMSTPFSPRLIGETEKTLGALLRRFLEGTGLTESEWVTLRLADELDGSVGSDGLAAALSDRAHFADAIELVHGLTDRGLLDDGCLTSVGRDLTAEVQAKITAQTAPIWQDLPIDDVAATTRVLNEVIARARAVLA